MIFVLQSLRFNILFLVYVQEWISFPYGAYNIIHQYIFSNNLITEQKFIIVADFTNKNCFGWPSKTLYWFELDLNCFKFKTWHKNGANKRCTQRHKLFHCERVMTLMLRNIYCRPIRILPSTATHNGMIFTSWTFYCLFLLCMTVIAFSAPCPDSKALSIKHSALELYAKLGNNIARGWNFNILRTKKMGTNKAGKSRSLWRLQNPWTLQLFWQTHSL